VAEVTTHAARIGIGDQVWQTELVEKGRVGLTDLVVRGAGFLFSDVEGVEIFHQELTASKQTLARTSFIAVLPRYLVKP
jgi:hypothetical protein